MGCCSWRPLWLPWTWLPLAALLAIFAATTLWLLAHRRRKVGDASLAFWRLGLMSLLAAVACVPLALRQQSSDPTLLLAGVLFMAGFALSVVNAMLYKIVPFLIWLHLQQRISANPAARHRIAAPGNLHRPADVLQGRQRRNPVEELED